MNTLNGVPPAVVIVPGLTAYGDPTAISFAFLGAYFFSIQMLFRRYAVRDLSGGAYSAVAVRVMLAVMGTWAVLACFAAAP